MWLLPGLHPLCAPLLNSSVLKLDRKVFLTSKPGLEESERVHRGQVLIQEKGPWTPDGSCVQSQVLCHLVSVTLQGGGFGTCSFLSRTVFHSWELRTTPTVALAPPAGQAHGVNSGLSCQKPWLQLSRVTRGNLGLPAFPGTRHAFINTRSIMNSEASLGMVLSSGTHPGEAQTICAQG